MKFIEESATESLFTPYSSKTAQLQKSMSSTQSKVKNDSQQNSKISRWTYEENLLYVRFLRQNLQKVVNNKSKSKKKFLKFERMSAEIVSKSADQCRSHHQKMMMRFKSIENVINGLLNPTQPPKTKLMTKQEKQIEEIDGKQMISEEPTEPKNAQQDSNQILSFYSIQSFRDQDIFDVLFQFKNE